MNTGSLFSRQPAPLLGLDISTSSVKLVELGQDRSGQLTLERCGIELFESGWISDGNIEKFDEVVEATRRLVSRSGTKAKNVAMALPASVVISKKIILPGGLSEREMEVQVESEANQYIPFSLDEVALDFSVVGPSATSAGDVEVVIAASRKEKVEDRQGLAEAAGLVRREQAEHDARSSWLQLTAEGERRLAGAVTDLGPERSALIEALAHLEDEE